MHGEVRLSGGGSVALVRVDGSELDIVNAARASFGKTSATLDDKDVRLLQFLVDEGHTSPLEMAGTVWQIEVPIFVARQIMRHRTASWSELSRRYTDENIEFWSPEQGAWRADGKGNKQVGDQPLDAGLCQRATWAYDSAIAAVLLDFGEMRRVGVCKEQARAVLPVATMTRIVCSFDVLNLCKFLSLRTADDAQAETRELALAMQKLAREHFPTVIGRWEIRARLDADVRSFLRRCRKEGVVPTQVPFA